MKKLKLEGLGVQIPVRERDFLQKHNPLSSPLCMREEVCRLSIQYGADINNHWNPKWDRSCPRGIYSFFSFMDERYVHILYLEGEEVVREAVGAHEEVHAAFCFGQEYYLNEILINDLGLQRGARLYDWGEEGFAHRGAVIPLIKRGFQPREALEVLAKHKVLLVVPHMISYFLEPFIKK